MPDRSGVNGFDFATTSFEFDFGAIKIEIATTSFEFDLGAIKFEFATTSTDKAVENAR